MSIVVSIELIHALSAVLVEFNKGHEGASKFASDVRMTDALRNLRFAAYRSGFFTASARSGDPRPSRNNSRPVSEKWHRYVGYESLCLAVVNGRDCGREVDDPAHIPAEPAPRCPAGSSCYLLDVETSTVPRELLDDVEPDLGARIDAQTRDYLIEGLGS